MFDAHYFIKKSCYSYLVQDVRSKTVTPPADPCIVWMKVYCETEDTAIRVNEIEAKDL